MQCRVLIGIKYANKYFVQKRELGKENCRTQRHYVLPRTLKKRYLNKIQNRKLFKVGLIQYGLYRLIIKS